MKLGDYTETRLPPWDWVNRDCCRWVDRWVVLQGHPSPMQAIELRYDSERSALRRITWGGGLVRLLSRGMREAGVPETPLPIAGDVGVVESQTVCGADQASGILTGSRWVTLGLRGFDAFPAVAVAVAVAVRAWRV